MPIVQLEDIFNLGVDILGTTIDGKGTILAQTGDVVAAEVISDNTEWWQHVGFASRPARAQEGKAACQALCIATGSNDIAFATRDIRGGAIYGNLKDGETAIYAPGPDGTGQGAVLLKQDGSVTLMTSDDNTAEGSGVYLKIAPDKLQFLAPWGTLTFDRTGFHCVTNTGARLDLGALGAPGPLATLMPNYFRITSAVVTIDSPTIMLGPTDGLFQSAVYSTIPPPALGVPLLAPAAVVPAGAFISGGPGSPVTGVTATIPGPLPAAGSTRVFVGV